MSSTPIVLKYPFDPTGTNPNNLALAEEHTLVGGEKRAIVPDHGPFYAESVVIRDQLTGQPLTPKTDFVAIELYQEATREVGKEICAAVVVTNPMVSQQIEMDYQVVGGEFSVGRDGLRQALEAANLDDRPVGWGEIINRPSAFPAAPHLHDIGDVYGFEYIIAALDDVRYAVRTKDEASHVELRNYFQSLKDAADAALLAHMENYENPHRVTKTQVGLWLLENFPIATQTEAMQGTVNDKYMTPLRTTQAIETQAIAPLNSHKADYSNPHRVTKAQVGLGSVDNTSDMNKPVSTAQSSAIDAHTSRTDNPHNVTASQVGSYTTAQADNLLNQRLPIGGTAANSHRLQGLSASQIINGGVSQAINQANSLFASKYHGHSQYASSSHSHSSYSGGNDCFSYDPNDGRG